MESLEIAVELSQILGETTPTIDSRWYELAKPRQGREPRLQHKIDDVLRRHLLYAQWEASKRRKLDRRHAIRASVLTPVTTGGRKRLVGLDISLRGLGCAGTPHAPIMDVEFTLPGNVIPIAARVEVAQYKSSNVVPCCGLRFVDIESPYIEHIAEFIQRRRAA